MPRFVIEVAYVFIVNDLLVAEPKKWTIIILTLSDRVHDYSCWKLCITCPNLHSDINVSSAVNVIPNKTYRNMETNGEYRKQTGDENRKKLRRM